jgi:hypothetical protein
VVHGNELKTKKRKGKEKKKAKRKVRCDKTIQDLR